MSRTYKFPRVPLPRQRGGAHGAASKPARSSRADIAERLNELAEEDSEVPAGDDLPYHYIASFDYSEDDWFDDNYYGDLVEKLDAGGRIH